MYWLQHNYFKRLDARIEGRALTSDGGGEQGTEMGAGGAPPAAAPPPQRTLLNGGEPAAGDESDSSAPAEFSWPENWRDVVAGDDADAKKLLERFTSPEDIRKKLVAQEKLIHAGKHRPGPLPEHATKAEVAEYRKALGVPDKPEGYQLAFPDEVKATDSDKQMLSAFAQHMNEHHVPPAAAKAAFSFYAERMKESADTQVEAVREATLENVAELRKEFPGREYARNIGLANDFLVKHFDGEPEALQMALEARLPNGMKLGDYAPFVKGIVAMARSYADDSALIGGDGAGGGLSIEEEYKSLISKSVGTPKEMSERDHARLLELAGAKARGEERRGNRAV